RHRRRKNSEGYVGARNPHRRDKIRTLPSGKIRRQLRRSIEGSAEEKAEGREDRSAERARTGQSHQSHGCIAPKRERGTRRRWATKAVPQQRPAPHHETRRPLVGAAEEGRLAPPRVCGLGASGLHVAKLLPLNTARSPACVGTGSRRAHWRGR